MQEKQFWLTETETLSQHVLSYILEKNNYVTLILLKFKTNLKLQWHDFSIENIILKLSMSIVQQTPI